MSRVTGLQLEDLRTVGAATARWLRAVGITTVAELRRVGAPEAYGRIEFRFGAEVNLNLLYALAGALEDRAYNSFTVAEKARLRRAAGVRAKKAKTPRRKPSSRLARMLLLAAAATALAPAARAQPRLAQPQIRAIRVLGEATLAKDGLPGCSQLIHRVACASSGRR
ncbi:MAG: TfoX/Sxy family protein [Gemmatimonadales bacterium]